MKLFTYCVSCLVLLTGLSLLAQYMPSSSSNAATATQLAADPTDCSAGPPQQYAKSIDSRANLTCQALAAGDYPTLFTQTSDVTVFNTQSETSLLGTGTGSLTIPAAALRAGKSLRIRAYGYHSAVSAPTIEIKIKLAGNTILDSTAIASHNQTNAGVLIDAVITCRTAGGMGTVMAQGQYVEFGNAAFQLTNTSTNTVDTTGTLLFGLTAQWGATSMSDTITITNVLLSLE